MNKWLKILTGALILAAVGIMIGYFYINKPHPDYENLEAEFKVQADDLYSEFSANTEQASQKYNGRMLAVSGSPDYVETADTMVIAVFVFNEGMFGDEGIRCTMLPDYNKIRESFYPGEEITLKGFCSGFNGTDVIIEKCSLTK